MHRTLHDRTYPARWPSRKLVEDSRTAGPIGTFDSAEADAKFRAIMRRTSTWIVYALPNEQAGFDGGAIPVNGHRMFISENGELCIVQYTYAGNAREGLVETLPFTLAPGAWVACIKQIPATDLSVN